MKGIRQRRRASGWRELVSRQARGGQTVQAFCEREGISTASFYGWRSRLKQAGDIRTVRQKAPAPGFIDLGELGKPDGTGARFQVRLELGSGMVLSIGRG